MLDSTVEYPFYEILPPMLMFQDNNLSEQDEQSIKTLFQSGEYGIFNSDIPLDDKEQLETYYASLAIPDDTEDNRCAIEEASRWALGRPSYAGGFGTL